MSTLELVMTLGGFCGAIAAIWALIDKISKPIKGISKKLDGLSSWCKKQQEDIESSKIEREIICRALRALSMWAIEQGANGEVHSTLDELNGFLYKKSHAGKSYLDL